MSLDGVHSIRRHAGALRVRVPRLANDRIARASDTPGGDAETLEELSFVVLRKSLKAPQLTDVNTELSGLRSSLSGFICCESHYATLISK